MGLIGTQTKREKLNYGHYRITAQRYGHYGNVESARVFEATNTTKGWVLTEAGEQRGRFSQLGDCVRTAKRMTEGGDAPKAGKTSSAPDMVRLARTYVVQSEHNVGHSTSGAALRRALNCIYLGLHYATEPEHKEWLLSTESYLLLRHSVLYGHIPGGKS